MARPSPRHSGNPTLKAIGNVIRASRLERGLSQEALANIVGIDRSYMGGIERGEHNLTVVSLVKIAHHLDITPSELLRFAGI